MTLMVVEKQRCSLVRRQRKCLVQKRRAGILLESLLMRDLRGKNLRRVDLWE